MSTEGPNLPPTTDPTIIAEIEADLQLTLETNLAVSRLFSAIAMHNKAIGLAAGTAVDSEDLAVIGNLRSVLVLMTDSLEQLEQPLPATAAPTVES